jgi:hypothetical protein
VFILYLELWCRVDLWTREISRLQRGRGLFTEAQQAVDAMLVAVGHILLQE